MKTVEEKLRVEVMHELAGTRIPPFDLPTEVVERNRGGPGIHHLLIERVPRQDKLRYIKSTIGRVAIELTGSTYTVFQPRWLGPLEEELAAISDFLYYMPLIQTNYVEAWLSRKAIDGCRYWKAGEIVPEKFLLQELIISPKRLLCSQRKARR